MKEKVYLLENHAFEIDKRYYIYEVYGENILSVDYVTYCVTKTSNNKFVEEIIKELHSTQGISEIEIVEAINELKDIGLLKEKPEELKHRCSDIDFPTEMGISGLALHLVHDCNLRCTYCYGAGGSFGGPRDYMSEETAIKAIDFLLAEMLRKSKK